MKLPLLLALLLGAACVAGCKAEDPEVSPLKAGREMMTFHPDRDGVPVFDAGGLPHDVPVGTRVRVAVDFKADGPRVRVRVLEGKQADLVGDAYRQYLRPAP